MLGGSQVQEKPQRVHSSDRGNPFTARIAAQLQHDALVVLATPREIPLCMSTRVWKHMKRLRVVT